MRYIRKQEGPSFFQEAIKGLEPNSAWEKIPKKSRQKLRKHILKNEQKGICAYCEINIGGGGTRCHIEHIKPKSDLANRFDYQNLIVSCNGKTCRTDEDAEDYRGDVHSCGHKKHGEFDGDRFLSPVAVKNISDFFAFGKEDGAIFPNPELAESEKARAQYTLWLLNLDNTRLNKYRRNARRALETELMEARQRYDKEEIRQKLNILLDSKSKKLQPFITYLRFCFSIALEKAIHKVE